MFYQKLQPDSLLNKNHNEKLVIDLLQKDNSSLKLIYLKKNDSFNSKISHTDIFIYVFEGEIELTFQKESACECCICGCDMPDEDDKNVTKYILKKNQMFMFKKNVTHDLTALKDCKFLLVKI